MGIKKETYLSNKQIIVNSAPHFAVGVVVSQAAGVEVNGKKIVKAGTPLAGDLDARTTAFTKANGANTVGILQHDVDVTDGNGNADLLLIGVVNVNMIDETTQALITAEVKSAIPTVKLIRF